MSRAGEVYENPVTGEWAVVRVGTVESGGELSISDLYISPGGAVAGEHVHPGIEEIFTVVGGSVGFRVDGREDVAGPGRRLVVPPGVAHYWWNAGDEEAHVVVELRGDANLLEGFETMLSTIFGMARGGKTDAKVLFGVLAPIARLLGYRAIHPEYGPSGVVEAEPWQAPTSATDVR